MAYCAPKGIPLSRFLSWDQADQDAALSWQAHESARCRSCGHHPDEGRPHTHLSLCNGCQAMESASKNADTKTPGVHVRISHGDRGDCPTCRTEDKFRRG